MEDLKSILSLLFSIGLVIFVFYGIYMQKEFSKTNDIRIQIKELTLENLKLDNKFKKKVIEDLDKQLKEGK